jgi:hypothetical protein
VGSRARLGNGLAHRPRASSNSEPRSCASSTFSSFFPHHHAPLLFSFSSPLPPFFIPSDHHAMPPAAILRHLPSLLFHPPPHCPHHHRRSQRACCQTCPTATAFANLSLYSIIPHIFPSPLSPSSHRISALLRCQCHQLSPPNLLGQRSDSLRGLFRWLLLEVAAGKYVYQSSIGDKGMKEEILLSG